MKKIVNWSIILLFLLLGIYFFSQHSGSALKKPLPKTAQAIVIPDRIVDIPIETGSTFGKLMTEHSDLSAEIVNGLYEASKPVYDLAKIRVGKNIELVYDGQTKKFKQLIYQIDSEDELNIIQNPKFKKIELRVDETITRNNSITTNTETKDNTGISGEEVKKTKEDNKQPEESYWLAKVQPIPYEVKTKVASGTVETSVYEAALKNNIDERAIIELANVFQWTIDFAMDPRVGDTFKFVYEERYLHGKYVMPGRILAAMYDNAGQKYYHYYFEENEDNKGYFDEKGNSVQKMFLKAPVEFKYISSGYTTGPRVVMEFGLHGPHRAIDYAAPLGTPIRTVGDGTVVFTGWKRGYGNFTSIRHNATYTTNYAHQSKILVHRGQKVKQGEIIGKVGSTGFSTGPHLHFEMVKHGVKINPLKEVLPPGKAIQKDNLPRFEKEVEKYNKLLKI